MAGSEGVPSIQEIRAEESRGNHGRRTAKKMAVERADQAWDMVRGLKDKDKK